MSMEELATDLNEELRMQVLAEPQSEHHKVLGEEHLTEKETGRRVAVM